MRSRQTWRVCVQKHPDVIQYFIQQTDIIIILGLVLPRYWKCVIMCLPLITSKHMANFSRILRGTEVWNTFNSYKAVKLNWGEGSMTAPLNNDNGVGHQQMQHIGVIPALGTRVVGICTHKTESYILDLSSFVAHKTVFYAATDWFFLIFILRHGCLCSPNLLHIQWLPVDAIQAAGWFHAQGCLCLPKTTAAAPCPAQTKGQTWNPPAQPGTSAQEPSCLRHVLRAGPTTGLQPSLLRRAGRLMMHTIKPHAVI